MLRDLQSTRLPSVAILLFALSCTATKPGGDFLSYDLSNTDASEGERLVDVCRISGTFAHVAVVELSGDPVDIAPQCPMPEIPHRYMEYPVKTVEAIAGSPAQSMRLASGLIDGSGFPQDSSVADLFLVSLRKFEGLWLVAEAVPVDYHNSSFAARGNTMGPVDLPHEIVDLKSEISTQSRTPCPGNSYLWQDDATIQALWDENDSYCENTGWFGEEDSGPGFWPGSGE